MKRPLLLFAAVLVLGILLLNMRESTRNLFLTRVPAFRIYMDRGNLDFSEGELTGTVEYAEFRKDKVVFHVKAPKEYGTVYAYMDLDLLGSVSVSDFVGAEIRMKGSYFRMKKAENPGEFDTREYYDNLRVFLGFKPESAEITKSSRNFLKKGLFRLSEKAWHILSAYSETEDYGWFLKLLGGSSGEVSEEMSDALRDSFLKRILSVSGFLSMLLGSFLYRVISKMTGNHLVRFLSVSFFLGIYGMLCGFPIAFLRAMILQMIRYGAPVFRRTFDTLSGAALLYILILLENPLLLFTGAMKFYGVMLLSTGVTLPLLKRFFRVREAGFLTVFSFFFLQCVLLPLILSETYGVNLYGGLILLILIPIRTVSYVLLSIGVIVGLLVPKAFALIRFFMSLVHYFRLFTEWISEAVSRLPGALIVTGKPAFWRCLLYEGMLCVIPVVYKWRLVKRKYLPENRENRERPYERKILVIAGILLYGFGLMFLRYEKPKGNDFRYTMLSVGQGDSGIVFNDRFAVLVDSGSSSLDNAGEITKNALMYYGIRDLDAVILSHGDRDHTNGLPDILKFRGFHLKSLILPDTAGRKSEFQSVTEALEATGQIDRIPVYYKASGDRIDLPGAFEITFLSPAKNSAYSGNDGSLVFTIGTLKDAVLFTGDISSEVEVGIRGLQPVTILKTAHHGSKYSTSAEFLEKVKPKTALISYGKGNSYGHPSGDTLARFRALQIPYFGTGEYGAMEVTFTGNEPKFRYYGGASE